MSGELFEKADIVYSYTRKQAIEDGELVDVSKTAIECGIKIPVAVTRALWDGYIVPDKRSRPYGQSEAGRLWDVLFILRQAARSSPVISALFLFEVIFIQKLRQRRLVKLKAVCGPGDDGLPVITLMLPNED